MLRLTNLADYGVLLMGEISKNTEVRHSAQELSKSTSMPVPTVSKILNILSKHGLLTSFRGLKGGFILSRPAEDISLADIIAAIDGPIALTHCAEEDPDNCDYQDICTMRPHWVIINETVKAALKNVSLKKVTGPTAVSKLLEVTE